MATTDKPFPDAMRELMQAHGLSFRALEAATREADPHGKGLTNAYLNQLANGRVKLSVEAIRRIAGVLGVAPCYFMEYRAATAAQALAFREKGSPELAERLRLLVQALDASEEARRAWAPWLEDLHCSAETTRLLDTIVEVLDMPAPDPSAGDRREGQESAASSDADNAN